MWRSTMGPIDRNREGKKKKDSAAFLTIYGPVKNQCLKVVSSALSAAILYLAAHVHDVMNKANMCGM